MRTCNVQLDWLLKTFFIYKFWVGFHDGAATFAGAFLDGIIVFFEMRKEIFFDVVQLKVGFVEFVVAVFAKPKQTIGESFSGALSFDD